MESITIVGRLGRDGELASANGKQFLKMNVAVSSKRKGQEVTRWYQCNLWGMGAEPVSRYALKGREVVITGKFSVDEYEKDGEKRYSLRIDASDVQLVGRSQQSEQNHEPSEVRSIFKKQSAPSSDDDSLPF